MTRREGKESLTVHKQALAAEPKRLHKVRVVAAQRPLCIQRSAAPPQLLRDLATVAQQCEPRGDGWGDQRARLRVRLCLRRRWARVLGRALCEQQPCAETFLSLSKLPMKRDALSRQASGE